MRLVLLCEVVLSVNYQFPSSYRCSLGVVSRLFTPNLAPIAFFTTLRTAVSSRVLGMNYKTAWM